MDHDTETFFEIDRVMRRPAKAGRGRSEILVVDDEPAICAMVAEILSPLGYVVHAAHAGAEGLTLFQANRARVGLVLIDVVMPGMDGLTLLAAVRKSDADVATVLVSGRLTEDTRWLASERGCRYLAKPFNVAELGQLAEEILGPPRDAAR